MAALLEPKRRVSERETDQKTRREWRVDSVWQATQSLFSYQEIKGLETLVGEKQF